jgi:hypothetical protein
VTITELGTLPVSSINIGLAASIPGLTAEVEKLQADLAAVGAALQAQIAFSGSFPPNLVGYAASFTASLDPLVMAASFNPATWLALNADGSAQLVADLAAINAQIELMLGIVGPLQVGLDAGSLTGWTYAGSARGYGRTLADATAAGFGGVGPADQVDAIIIGAADFAAWGSFSDGFETGGTAGTDLGETTTASNLTAQGTLSGAQWNTGVRDVFDQLAAFLLELQGLAAAIEAQIQLSIGIGLPNPVDIVDIGLSIDLAAALQNIGTVTADLGVQITGLTAQIQVILDLITELEAQLSAAGLTVWSYSGPAGALGSSFLPEVQDGLPGVGLANGSTYGVVVASGSPTAWADFGQIFITG